MNEDASKNILEKDEHEGSSRTALKKTLSPDQRLDGDVEEGISRSTAPKQELSFKRLSVMIKNEDEQHPEADPSPFHPRFKEPAYRASELQSKTSTDQCKVGKSNAAVGVRAPSDEASKLQSDHTHSVSEAKMRQLLQESQ